MRAATFEQSELIELARFYAAEVGTGRYPYVQFDAERRWHQRLYRDPRVDVWLLSWLPDQRTQLHDHGGSAGAFTVLQGELTEAVYSPSGLRDVIHAAGHSSAFGRHYVHDVRNLDSAPAVSVHAYSPPLTSMTFYDLVDGRLTEQGVLATDDPEPVIALPAAS